MADSIENTDEEDLMITFKDALLEQSEVEYFEKLRLRCFNTCVDRKRLIHTAAGSKSLSGAEKECLDHCIDRFREAIEIVSRIVLQHE